MRTAEHPSRSPSATSGRGRRASSSTVPGRRAAPAAVTGAAGQPVHQPIHQPSAGHQQHRRRVREHERDPVGRVLRVHRQVGRPRLEPPPATPPPDPPTAATPPPPPLRTRTPRDQQPRQPVHPRRSAPRTTPTPHSATTATASGARATCASNSSGNVPAGNLPRVSFQSTSSPVPLGRAEQVDAGPPARPGRPPPPRAPAGTARRSPARPPRRTGRAGSPAGTAAVDLGHADECQRDSGSRRGRVPGRHGPDGRGVGAAPPRPVASSG